MNRYQTNNIFINDVKDSFCYLPIFYIEKNFFGFIIHNIYYPLWSNILVIWSLATSKYYTNSLKYFLQFQLGPRFTSYCHINVCNLYLFSHHIGIGSDLVSKILSIYRNDIQIISSIWTINEIIEVMDKISQK